MKIVIGSDHAGFNLKEEVIQFLTNAVNDNTFEAGVLLCGSANGVAITANKYANVRAAVCWIEEIALLARQHNHANLLCLPARFITNKEAFTITKSFLNTSYEGGRHLRRVEKIKQVIL